MSDERIDHPPHYGGDTVYEADNVIEAWGLGFRLGNVAKYLCRAGKKPGRSHVLWTGCDSGPASAPLVDSDT